MYAQTFSAISLTGIHKSQKGINTGLVSTGYVRQIEKCLGFGFNICFHVGQITVSLGY